MELYTLEMGQAQVAELFDYIESHAQKDLSKDPAYCLPPGIAQIKGTLGDVLGMRVKCIEDSKAGVSEYQEVLSGDTIQDYLRLVGPFKPYFVPRESIPDRFFENAGWIKLIRSKSDSLGIAIYPRKEVTNDPNVKPSVIVWLSKEWAEALLSFISSDGRKFSNTIATKKGSIYTANLVESSIRTHGHSVVYRYDAMGNWVTIRVDDQEVKLDKAHQACLLDFWNNQDSDCEPCGELA